MRITANQVTFSRLVAMPALCGLLYGSSSALVAAVILGTFIGCTDFVDGYLARRQGPTVLGGLMDPIADKIFIAVCFLPLGNQGWVPAWVLAALFLREFLVTAVRSSFELRQKSMPSSYLAKVKTWVQMCGSGVVMIGPGLGAYDAIAWMLGIGVIGSLAGWLIVRLVFKKPWRGALVFAGCFGASLAVIVPFGPQVFDQWVWAAVLLFTWVSGIDYLVAGARHWLTTRDFGRFDAARLLPAALFPLLIVYALVSWGATPWAILPLVSLELAMGGLDNLLAHHGAGSSAASWGGRMITICALLGGALLWPGLASPLAFAALGVSLVGTTITFVQNRRFYLDAHLREQRAVPAASVAVG